MIINVNTTAEVGWRWRVTRQKHWPVSGRVWGHCWCHEVRGQTAQPGPSHFQMLDRASQHEIWHRLLDKYPGGITIGIFIVMQLFERFSTKPQCQATLMFSARPSISEVHFLMMKGTPSLLFFAAWAKSIPNRCSLPWSFLWPHWIASVSKHFLWQAREHWRETRENFKLKQMTKTAEMH